MPEIPSELIKVLTPVGLARFCKVRGKKPFEPGWNTPEKYYLPDNPELQQHLREGANYGILAGNGLINIDADDDKIRKLVEEKLPKTHTHLTGSGTPHYLYRSDLKSNIKFFEGTGKDKKDLGEAQGNKRQVVGPGSIHPDTRKPYTISENLPLAYVSEATIREIFAEYITKESEGDEETLTTPPTSKRSDNDLNIPITQVMNAYGIRSKQGEAPWHPGSKNHTHLVIDTEKDAWKCFRCDSGGGPLYLIAVAEGIIPCEEAKKGRLRGDDFKRTLDAARKHGLIEDSQKVFDDIIAKLKNKNECLPDTVGTFYGQTIPPKPTGGPNQEIIILSGKDTHALGETLEYNLTIERAIAALDTKIKYDTQTKTILFLYVCLNYTDQEQQNIAITGQSSSGKSHDALSVAEFFPRSDQLHLAYASSKSFFHEQGVLVASEDYQQFKKLDPIPGLAEVKTLAAKRFESEYPKPAPKKKGEEGPGVTDWREKKGEYVDKVEAEWMVIPKVRFIDLKQKILIFTDMPDDTLLKHLRPLLSHDNEIIEVKITDSKSSGGNLTKTVWLRGYPTVIFASARFNQDEQEQTRLVLLSPDVSQEKISASIDLMAESVGQRRVFKNRMEQDEARKQLIAHLEALKNRKIIDAVISKDIADTVVKEFKERNQDHLTPRHQRDFKRVMALIKAHAIFHYRDRKINDFNEVIATEADAVGAKKLYAEIAESNELGIPPVIYNLYHKKIEPITKRGEYITKLDLGKFFYEEYRTALGEKMSKNILDLLQNTGLLVEIKHPVKKGNSVAYVDPQNYLETIVYEEERAPQKRNRPQKGKKTKPPAKVDGQSNLTVNSCEICGAPGAFRHAARWLCKKHIDEVIQQDQTMGGSSL